MTVPKILLISATPPSTDGVGGLYLLECCRDYPADRLACLHFAPKHFLKSWSAELSGVTHEVHDWPYDRAWRVASGKLGSLSSYVNHGYSTWFRHHPALDRAMEMAKRFQPDLIWAVLDTPSMYYLPRRLAKHLQIPLLTTVWDPPETVCGGLGWDRWSIQSAEREFAASLRACVRISVVSENMQREYSTRYDIPTVLMRHLAPPEFQENPSRERDHNSAFRIGFCGSIYAITEWEALMAALDGVNWRLDGREVEVWIFGKRVLLSSPGRSNVRFFGWRPTEEMHPLLAQVDVAYLPYWFDDNRRESVQLCFPTKLGTYLSCGLPVLFHGPSYSSVAEFFRRYPVGITCDSLDSKNLVRCLQQLSNDTELLRVIDAARSEVLRTVLHRDLFLERFHEFVAVDQY